MTERCKAQVTDALRAALAAIEYRDLTIEEAKKLASAALAAQEKPEPGVAVEEAALQAVVDAMMMEQGSANVIRQKARNIIKAYRSALVAPSPDLPEGDAVQTIAVPEGTRVIVKMGAACDMIIRHPKEDGRCPRSCNHRPDDFSMRDCIEAGECGCIAFPSPIDKGEVK